MKKTLLAMIVLSTSFASQAETITHNATSCEVKYGNAEKKFNSGVIENRSGNYDVLSCGIPLESNRTVENIKLKLYASSTKENSGSNCRVSLYRDDSMGVIASADAGKADSGLNVLTADLNTMLTEPARAVANCTIGGVEEGGLVRFYSYSVTYAD